MSPSPRRTSALLAGAALVMLPLVASPTQAQAPAMVELTFEHTGEGVIFNVPVSTSSLDWELCGGAGGTLGGTVGGTWLGGLGAMVKVAGMAAMSGTSFEVNVGGRGTDGGNPGFNAPGGWNGGGEGGFSSGGLGGAGGGGASDVRDQPGGLNHTRLIVAAGGGGATEEGSGGRGGESGGAGGEGQTGAGGQGATPGTPGLGGSGSGGGSGQAGAQGLGGRGSEEVFQASGGGGGGGTFGGGGGGQTGGGGGGSSTAPTGAQFSTDACPRDHGYVRLSYEAVPDLDVLLTPEQQTILAGETADFVVRVTNAGNTPLEQLVVTDTNVPDCGRLISQLDIGATHLFSCSITTSEDLVHTVHVEADTTSTTETITVTADSVEAEVEVADPSVEIEIDPPSQVVLGGGVANFEVEVTNTGNTMLDDILVEVPGASDCDDSIGGLPVGDSHAYECSIEGVTEDLELTPFVSATDELSDTTVEHTGDPAQVRVAAPEIAVDITPPLQTIVAGEDAEFEVSVTNVDDSELTDVEVSGGPADCDRSFATLAAMAAETFTCTASGLTDDLTVVMEAVGTTAVGSTVEDASDEAEVDVVDPAITIEVAPPSQVVTEGEAAELDVTVTNAGDVDLAGATVTSDAPDCGEDIGALAAGESHEYECNHLALEDVALAFEATGLEPMTDSVVAADAEADVDVVAGQVDDDADQDDGDLPSTGGGAALAVVILLSSTMLGRRPRSRRVAMAARGSAGGRDRPTVAPR